MTEENLVKKLQLLRDIKPRKEWVCLTKSRIFAEEKSNSSVKSQKAGWGFLFGSVKPVFANKYAFAFACLFIVIGSVFALNSIPGKNVILSIRKMIEGGQAILVGNNPSVNKDPRISLEQANRQLADLLAKLTKGEGQGELASAINDYKSSVSEAARNLANEKDKAKLKELVAEVQGLENKEERIKSLGIEFGENYEKDLALVQLISGQVSILEGKELGKENQTRLLQVKDFCANGYFVEALDLILLINNSN